MNEVKKIWYSFFMSPAPDIPGFVDTSQFQWVRHIEENAPTIIVEIEQFLAENINHMAPYFSRTLVAVPEKWKTMGFISWNRRNRNNCALCPRTLEVMNQIPGLISVGISLLEPEAEILPHRGDTTAVLRGHLGLKIPSKLPECGFEAGGEQLSWEEGKVILFNDACEHRAWNKTPHSRCILQFDVIKPEYEHKKLHVCSTVLAALVMQKIAGTLPFLIKMPKFILAIVHATIRIPIHLTMKITG